MTWERSGVLDIEPSASVCQDRCRGPTGGRCLLFCSPRQLYQLLCASALPWVLGALEKEPCWLRWIDESLLSKCRMMEAELWLTFMAIHGIVVCKGKLYSLCSLRLNAAHTSSMMTTTSWKEF